jgi:hypothetical protein
MPSFVCLHHSHYLLERRRKTLLWLDDNPNSPENSRIRRSIPGLGSSKAVEGLGDERLSLAADNKDIALEDQVDVTLFTTVNAVIEFLCHPSQKKFAKYPPSLFRIVTNRRLYVGADGLCSRMSKDASWCSAFPATLVFHGDVHDGLHELMGRPNLVTSQVAADCEAFVSFRSVKAEVHGSSTAAAVESQVTQYAAARASRGCCCRDFQLPKYFIADCRCGRRRFIPIARVSPCALPLHDGVCVC